MQVSPSIAKVTTFGVRRALSTVAILGGVLSGSCTAAYAQAPDSTPAALEAFLRQAQLRNQLVHFETADASVEGRVNVLSDALFRVGGKAIDAGDVRVLRVRISKPDSLWNGTLIGAGVGAITIAPALIEFAKSGAERDISGRTKLESWVAGAVLGAVIGFMVDGTHEARPTWRTVWAARN